MSIFAIADLHLSFCPDICKPMDIYGPEWENHAERIEENWRSVVTDEDTVVLPGDISWGLKLEEARYDLEWIEALPGRKVVFKGNHDLWWRGITRLNSMYETVTFIQNDCYAGLADGSHRTVMITLKPMRRYITGSFSGCERLWKRLWQPARRLQAALKEQEVSARQAAGGYWVYCITRRYRRRQPSQGFSRYSRSTASRM